MCIAAALLAWSSLFWLEDCKPAKFSSKHAHLLRELRPLHRFSSTSYKEHPAIFQTCCSGTARLQSAAKHLARRAQARISVLVSSKVS